MQCQGNFKIGLHTCRLNRMNALESILISFSQYYSEQFIANVTPCFSTSRTVLIGLAMCGFARSQKGMPLDASV